MVLEKKPQSKKQTAKEGKTAIGKGGMRRENVTEEAKQAPTSPEIVVLDKHKRPMMPSSALLSSFYERNVVLNKFLYEEVKKVIEWIWSTSKKEGLYSKVEVASSIVDVWSVILNHEERFRNMLSGVGNVYCNVQSYILLHYCYFYNITIEYNYNAVEYKTVMQ
ncbi:hypothetical protein Tco_0441953 [Tanacetum coccineum]